MRPNVRSQFCGLRVLSETPPARCPTLATLLDKRSAHMVCYQDFTRAATGVPRPSKGAQTYPKAFRTRSKTFQHLPKSFRALQDTPGTSKALPRPSQLLPRPCEGVRRNPPVSGDLTRALNNNNTKTFQRRPITPKWPSEALQGIPDACQALAQGFHGPPEAFQGRPIVASRCPTPSKTARGVQHPPATLQSYPKA